MLTRIKLRFLDVFNPIPTGHGRNQPIYERHVTKSGRNRVKDLYFCIDNCFSQNTNEKISQISALASKEWSNQKLC